MKRMRSAWMALMGQQNARADNGRGNGGGGSGGGHGRGGR
jgi:hypothetical protein